MTSSGSESPAHEIVGDTRKNDDGDAEEVSLPPESEQRKGKEKSTLSKEDDSLANEDGASDSASGGGSTATEGNRDDASASQEPQSWQAVFAPQYNAYYFYNSQTGETTWTNPLQPSPDSASSSSAAGPPNTSSPLSTEQGTYSDLNASETLSSSTSASASTTTEYSALQAAALAQGIDPSLAHLDPTLVTATTSASGGPIPAFQAKFNARTGAFTRPDARTPGHLSEYERMKRMSQFYFDVGAWEQQVAEDKEEEEENGKKRKRPTKKDLERFKEQKKQKKIAKTAWLRT